MSKNYRLAESYAGNDGLQGESNALAHYFRLIRDIEESDLETEVKEEKIAEIKDIQSDEWEHLLRDVANALEFGEGYIAPDALESVQKIYRWVQKPAEEEE